MQYLSLQSKALVVLMFEKSRKAQTAWIGWWNHSVWCCTAWGGGVMKLKCFLGSYKVSHCQIITLWTHHIPAHCHTRDKSLSGHSHLHPQTDAPTRMCVIISQSFSLESAQPPYRAVFSQHLHTAYVRTTTDGAGVESDFKKTAFKIHPYRLNSLQGRRCDDA